jgi:hypothetical protein
MNRRIVAFISMLTLLSAAQLVFAADNGSQTGAQSAHPIHQQSRDIRSDRRNKHQDHRQAVRDRRAGDTAGAVGERKDMRSDNRSIRKAKRTRRGDLRNDAKSGQQNSKGSGNG